MCQIKEKDLQFLCQQMLADKLEEYEATKEMSWIVDKGSEGILALLIGKVWGCLG